MEMTAGGPADSQRRAVACRLVQGWPMRTRRQSGLSQPRPLTAVLEVVMPEEEGLELIPVIFGRWAGSRILAVSRGRKPNL